MASLRGKASLLLFCLTAVACSATGMAGREPAPGARPRSSGPPNQVALSPSFGIKKVDVEEKLVALTFDDGPDPKYTPRVLDFARGHHIPLTFFLLGERVRLHPELARRMLAEGHAIGNHTWSHTVLIGLSEAEDGAEIEACEAEIEKICGYHTKLFRPPKGKVDETVARAAATRGYEIILWSVAVEHHDAKTPQAMADRVVQRVRPGSIILAHDGSPHQDISRDRTVAALPMLVDELRRRGYRFVTVPELLARAAKERVARGRR